VSNKELCHCCHKPFRVRDLNTVAYQAAKQTHWTPAEWEEVLVCDECYRYPEEAVEDR
jgi:hypothetical protein